MYTHTVTLSMMQFDLSLAQPSCSDWQALDSRMSLYYSSVHLCVLNLSEPITGDCSVILTTYLSHLSSLLPLNEIWFSSHEHGLDFSSELNLFFLFSITVHYVVQIPTGFARGTVYLENWHSHCLNNLPDPCTASFNCWSLKWDSIKMNDLH